jgi:hypothetical protein
VHRAARVLRAPLSCIALLVGGAASADTVRYFAVWSYVDNRPADELPADRLSERELGYWALEFDDEGRVLGGTYHGAGGAVWLRLRYLEENGRIYADLFAADGRHVARKSTQLSTRIPQPPIGSPEEPHGKPAES